MATLTVGTENSTGRPVGFSVGGGEVVRYLATYGTGRVSQAVLSMAAGASPKGTLDCIGAFARTDFRKDLAALTTPRSSTPH